MKSLNRKTTGGEIGEKLRREIESGRLGPGSRLDEVRLAGVFGVSRTPVREAILALERDGLVERQPYKGCRVASFDDRKIKEMFPIVAALEALSIREAGIVSPADVTKLRRLNTSMADPTADRATKYRLDRAFHVGLAKLSGNDFLSVEHARLLDMTARHDGNTARGLAEVDRSVAEHEAIISAIERGDNAGAADLVEAHRRGGVSIIKKWRSVTSQQSAD